MGRSCRVAPPQPDRILPAAQDGALEPFFLPGYLDIHAAGVALNTSKPASDLCRGSDVSAA
jgi:hypothetical protein